MKNSLICISPPDRRLERQLLDAEGGFLWWYADMIDEHGDGLVLIWSYGLPFLPGYARTEKRGRPQKPRERPSLNLSIYRDGRLDFYLLQEFAPEQVDWSACGNLWRFGQSHLQTKDEGGRVELTADLDCAVGGCDERLVGRFELDGVPRQHVGFQPPRKKSRKGRGFPDEAHSVRVSGDSGGQLPDHDWTPRTGPAKATADLRHGEHVWRLEGRGYHDRNGGALPLHDLGIDHWVWGRAPLPGRELIYYLLWEEGRDTPVALGMTIDEHGRTELVDDLEVELGERRRNLGGLVWWRSLELTRAGRPWLSVRHSDVVDSGPFYMRYLTEARLAGHTARGVGELCQPDRIDLDRHRPLVRMRVHDLDGRNSMWLPLFSGPKEGRVRRLFESWLAGGPR
ncbi:MAG: hypothetical protein ACLFVJ_20150 [Persicimonas sp.]